MFANDSRKYEVRERMERNDWEDFLLNDFGLVTLIYEMDTGDSVKLFDDKDRFLHVIKREEGLTLSHKDFIVYKTYLEVNGTTAYFKNEHVVLGISLVNSKVLDYFGENLEALS